MSADYGPAIWLGNDQIGYGGWVSDFRPKWIVVHGTAGDATIESIQRTFMTKPASDKSSTHYGVGMDGRVGQYAPETAPAWGNGPITGPAGHAIAGRGNAHDVWWDQQPIRNANPYTLSIEHCKPDTRNASALTPAQKAASFALIKHLCDAHGIPKRVYGTATPCDANGGVTGHFSMDPLERAFCPGDYPWQELQDYLDGTTGTTGTTGTGGGGGDVAWHENADGTGIDGKGNHCGAGFMAELLARGETASDGRMSETYVSGAQGFKSFLPLANGDVLVWDGTQVTHDGALVCAELYRLLVAAQHQPAPADPIKDKALAALQQLKSALAEL